MPACQHQSGALGQLIPPISSITYLELLGLTRLKCSGSSSEVNYWVTQPRSDSGAVHEADDATMATAYPEVR